MEFQDTLVTRIFSIIQAGLFQSWNNPGWKTFLEFLSSHSQLRVWSQIQTQAGFQVWIFATLYFQRIPFVGELSNGALSLVILWKNRKSGILGDLKVLSWMKGWNWKPGNKFPAKLVNKSAWGISLNPHLFSHDPFFFPSHSSWKEKWRKNGSKLWEKWNFLLITPQKIHPGFSNFGHQLT